MKVGVDEQDHLTYTVQFYKILFIGTEFLKLKKQITLIHPLEQLL